MLITHEWSTPQQVAYGKNITLQYSKPGFAVKVFSASGKVFEAHITDGKQHEIRASEINSIAHPMITLKTIEHPEIHVHIDVPAY